MRRAARPDEPSLVAANAYYFNVVKKAGKLKGRRGGRGVKAYIAEECKGKMAELEASIEERLGSEKRLESMVDKTKKQLRKKLKTKFCGSREEQRAREEKALKSAAIEAVVLPSINSKCPVSEKAWSLQRKEVLDKVWAAAQKDAAVQGELEKLEEAHKRRDDIKTQALFLDSQCIEKNKKRETLKLEKKEELEKARLIHQEWTAAQAKAMLNTRDRELAARQETFNRTEEKKKQLATRQLEQRREEELHNESLKRQTLQEKALSDARKQDQFNQWRQYLDNKEQHRKEQKKSLNSSVSLSHDSCNHFTGGDVYKAELNKRLQTQSVCEGLAKVLHQEAEKKRVDLETKKVNEIKKYEEKQADAEISRMSAIAARNRNQALVLDAQLVQKQEQERREKEMEKRETDRMLEHQAVQDKRRSEEERKKRMDQHTYINTLAVQVGIGKHNGLRGMQIKIK